MPEQDDIEESRIISSYTKEEDHQEKSLRPKTIKEFIGQEKLKKNLGVYIEAAKIREESIEHVLLYGPPGLGKTTLASIISLEMNVNIKITSGPAIERPGDLAAILTNLEEGDVLFIDEIHRLNRSVEEVLYPAMEDFELDIIIGKGPSARSIRLDVAKFTLIGATTRVGLLSAPLRDRFGIIERLEYYLPEELEDIITRAASILNTKINKTAALEVAKRSRGTPRIANRLLKRVRDWAQVHSHEEITTDNIQKGLEGLGIDDIGLDDMDRLYLDALISKFNGGPVGVETIAACISEESETLEDVVEPYLLQQGFIERTARGRTSTARAYTHLGLETPANKVQKQTELF
ncbi:Holliday junction branch migration DNA helicase RuvB [Candidatus Marinamargulisbacteria bacterium SCGC AG-343-D04]|nr:Holliday junction branch migration DNA helicase RuvB [Candidatus Marinamargulisbacteria bacterium SCGC AG-343-D04]